MFITHDVKVSRHSDDVGTRKVLVDTNLILRASTRTRVLVFRYSSPLDQLHGDDLTTLFGRVSRYRISLTYIYTYMNIQGYLHIYQLYMYLG